MDGYADGAVSLQGVRRDRARHHRSNGSQKRREELMSDIAKRLRATLRYDAIGGTSTDRDTVRKQVNEAVEALEQMQAERDLAIDLLRNPERRAWSWCEESCCYGYYIDGAWAANNLEDAIRKIVKAAALC